MLDIEVERFGHFIQDNDWCICLLVRLQLQWFHRISSIMKVWLAQNVGSDRGLQRGVHSGQMLA